jgi:hypothetical protein
VQAVAGMAAVEPDNLLAVCPETGDRFVPEPQVIGGEDERRSFGVFAGDGFELKDLDGELIARLGAVAEQKPAHLGAPAWDSAEALHHLEQHAIDDIKVKMNGNGLLRGLPSVEGKLFGGLRTWVQLR